MEQSPFAKLGHQTHSHLSNHLWNLTSSNYPTACGCVCTCLCACVHAYASAHAVIYFDCVLVLCCVMGYLFQLGETAHKSVHNYWKIYQGCRHGCSTSQGHWHVLTFLQKTLLLYELHLNFKWRRAAIPFHSQMISHPVLCKCSVNEWVKRFKILKRFKIQARISSVKVCTLRTNMYWCGQSILCCAQLMNAKFTGEIPKTERVMDIWLQVWKMFWPQSMNKAIKVCTLFIFQKDGHNMFLYKYPPPPPPIPTHSQTAHRLVVPKSPSLRADLEAH